MDEFINKLISSLPKPILALLVLAIAIGVFMIISPPHSVCDSQEVTFRELQAGNIFSREGAKKNTKIPARLARAKESCQLGNSAGSCYEYFEVLKKIADDINKANSECAPQLLNISEVKSAITDGVEVMARLAWGISPPESGLNRFGWLQESEIATFCRIKNVYVNAMGEETWTNLRRKIFAKLPGEEAPLSELPDQAPIEGKKATALLSEEEIWSRSLFSVRCEIF